MSQMNKLSRKVRNLVQEGLAREQLSWDLNSNLSDSKDTFVSMPSAGHM